MAHSSFILPMQGAVTLEGWPGSGALQAFEQCSVMGCKPSGGCRGRSIEEHCWMGLRTHRGKLLKGILPRISNLSYDFPSTVYPCTNLVLAISFPSHPPRHHQHTHSPTHLLTLPPAHPYTHPPMHLFKSITTHPHTHPCMCAPIHLTTHPSIRPLTQPYFRPSVHMPTHTYIHRHPHIHSVMYTYTIQQYISHMSIYPTQSAIHAPTYTPNRHYSPHPSIHPAVCAYAQTCMHNIYTHPYTLPSIYPSTYL